MTKVTIYFDHDSLQNIRFLRLYQVQSNIFPSKANEGEIEHTAKVTEKRIILQFVLRLFCKRLTYCFASIVVNWIHKTMETFPISIVRSYLA